MTGRPGNTGDGPDRGEGTVKPPAVTAGDDLMARREVAYRFGVTSATVKNWARSTAVALTEVHDGQGKPRYRRAEVEALYASGFRGFESRSAASRLRRR